MDLDKLSILGGAAKYDICASTSSGVSKVKNPLLGNPVSSGICHSFTPDGRCVSLLKVLMTNECQKDCGYCVNRAQQDIPRTSFSPEELSRIFIELYRRNYVEGLFLSSGIRQNSQRSMEELIKTAEILRERYRFGGYIHLKILPGSKADYIAQAGRLANRVSLNLEVPSGKHLAVISPTKDYARELVQPLESVAQTIKDNPGVSQTTQFVVGAARESDQEILSAVTRLYAHYRVKRSYFSAFQPVAGTPLGHLPATPLKRENRLYQADFLLRHYNFKAGDLYYNDRGNLDLALDPKLMYAVKNPQLFPIEINRATYRQLLLIPGIGPKSAGRIISLRKRHRLTSLEELKNIGVVVKRASPFVTIAGRMFGSLDWLCNPNPAGFVQLSFW